MATELSVDDFLQLDQLCDRFESAWSLESDNQLESWLSSVPEHLRRTAFQELLKVDIELRARSGNSISADSYVEQFPEFGDLIESVLDTTNAQMNTVMLDDTATAFGENVEQGSPRKFGRFELRKELGQGAFGAVYQAYDPTLDRLVALKLPRFADTDRARVERFLEEAQIAARMHHPNIVAVWERGRCEDQFYISSEFVLGETLEEILEQQQTSLETKVEWARDLAVALHYAHQEKVIHRDLKPANVIVNRQGRPMVMDFGLAKRMDLTTTQTTDGSILGTPGYMSPEQARGAIRELDAKTDQYSLGAVFYELLTGQPLYAGPMNKVLVTLTQDPAPPDFSAGPQLPVDLIAVCQKMLQPSKEERYTDCQEVARDLTNWMDGHPVRVRRVSLVERFSKWCHRNPMVSSLLLMLTTILVVSLVAVSLAFIRASKSEQKSTTNWRLAQFNERRAIEEYQNAQAAAIAERQQVSRSRTILAGIEIRAGRFQEATALLEEIDQQDRNWVWQIQRARVPKILSQFQLPTNATAYGLRAFYDDDGKRLAITFHDNLAATVPANDLHLSTWLLDVETGELIDQLHPDYLVASPLGGTFSKGGRYLILYLHKGEPNQFQDVGVYDTKERRVVASRSNVRNYVPSPYRENEVLLQVKKGKRYHYLVWDFLKGTEALVREGGYAMPYNYSTDVDSTELCVRNNNWVYFTGVKPENKKRSELMHRLGATHWNISDDGRFVVGQLQNVWPWNARGLTVAAGQTAVVELPLKMKTVLEPARDISATLLEYQHNLSERVDNGEIPRGFFVAHQRPYVLLDMVNRHQFSSGKRELGWWSLTSGEYIGKAAGMAVSPTGESFVSENEGMVVVREAPLRVRRFRSRTVEEQLASLQPIHPTPNKRLYPEVCYVRGEPWVVVSAGDLTDSIDVANHVIHRHLDWGQRIAHVAVDHLRQRIAFHSREDQVEVVSATTGKVLQTLQLKQTGARYFVAFDPGGNDLWVGDAKGIGRWAIATGELLERHDEYPCSQAPGSLSVSKSGKYLLLNGAVDRSFVIDLDSGRSIRTGPLHRSDYRLSADESLLLSNDSYGKVRIERIEDQTVVGQIFSETRSADVQFHPNKPILVVARHEGRLLMYDTNTWDVLLDESFPRGQRVTLRFDESGESLAIGIEYGTKRWFEFSSKQD